MTDITLRYSGESTVDPTNDQRVHDIVDALLAVFQDDSLSFETGRIGDRNGDLRFRFDLRKQTTLADAQAALDALAQQLVDLGIEPDTETASDNIRA